jgi:hydrogenase maturation protease
MTKPVLVLGVGNVLLSDEGIGVHIARRLQSMQLPPQMEVVDGGTGGYELIGFFQERKKVIIVDCVEAAEPAGTMICATPDQLDLRWKGAYSAHQTGLSELLHHARQLVPQPEITIVGIVPKVHTRPGTRLSDVLEPLVDEVASRVLQIAAQPYS